jgi:hypothetical protein
MSADRSAAVDRRFEDGGCGIAGRQQALHGRRVQRQRLGSPVVTVDDGGHLARAAE